MARKHESQWSMRHAPRVRTRKGERRCTARHSSGEQCVLSTQQFGTTVLEHTQHVAVVNGATVRWEE